MSNPNKSKNLKNQSTSSKKSGQVLSINAKLSKEEKKKMRYAAKTNMMNINVLCTNNKVIITKSTLGLSKMDNYSDPLSGHIAWNPKANRNIIDKNSSFAKKFGDLSSF
jgi:hypothetical protein